MASVCSILNRWKEGAWVAEVAEQTLLRSRIENVREGAWKSGT
jgi:hypothetical protein